MHSLIDSLRGRIQRSGGLHAARLRAEAAMHIARMGSDVDAELATLRSLNAAARDASLSTWIHLAEGVRELTRGRGEAGRSSLNRARAVAAADGMARELSVADAWLAYHAYTCSDIESMLRSARAVLDGADAADASALGRVHMLVGQSFHFAGTFARARPWYESAHAIATAIGDRALLSALLFNTASHHVCDYRHFELHGSQTSLSLDLLEKIAESVSNYDRHAGVTSLPSYESTLFASVDVFRGRYDAAMERYRQSFEQADLAGLDGMRCVYLSEMALCAARLDDGDRAQALAGSALEGLTLRVPDHSRAATYGRAAQVFELIGDDAGAADCRRVGGEAWARHEALQDAIVRQLQSQLPAQPTFM